MEFVIKIRQTFGEEGSFSYGIVEVSAQTVQNLNFTSITLLYLLQLSNY